MKPTESTPDLQGDLFRIELDRIVNSSHPLVRLGKEVDWNRLAEVFGKTYCEDNGRPATSTRLMVALQYLKYTFNLNDEQVCDGWRTRTGSRLEVTNTLNTSGRLTRRT